VVRLPSCRFVALLLLLKLLLHIVVAIVSAFRAAVSGTMLFLTFLLLLLEHAHALHTPNSSEAQMAKLAEELNAKSTLAEVVPEGAATGEAGAASDDAVAGST
jgi:hypothetical protein